MRIPLCRFLAASLVLVFSAALAAAQSKVRRVTVVRADNSAITGDLLSLNEKEVVVRTETNATIVPLDDVFELIFINAKSTEPSPTSGSSTKVDPAAYNRCRESFRRIMIAINVGISLIDYRRELLEARALFDPPFRDLPQSQQRTDLLEAMRDLQIAADVWQVGIENDGIPTKTDFYRSINSRYSLGLSPRIGIKANHNAVLRTIWAEASNRLRRADDLQK